MQFADLVTDPAWRARITRQATNRKGANPVKLATAVERSKNIKTGIVHATYTTQLSCADCPLMGEACYAESGTAAMTTAAVNYVAMLRATEHRTPSPEEIAAEEAFGIDTLSATLPLRLHVVGDAKTDAAAAIIAAACERFIDRSPNGARPWTYTHAWRDVSRASWGKVDVLASCDTLDQIPAARARGYVACATIAEMPASPVVRLASGGRGIVCPQQRGLTDCANCTGLCRDTANMAKHDLTVLFVIHGQNADLARTRLDNPRDGAGLAA